jgi:transposase-like protein
MLQLEINPIVLETLKQNFPKPKNSAQKALDKYIKLLTQQLSKSILLGRNAWMQTNDLYSISVSKQRNRGSQIGSEKIRLQNWLENNNLELFRIIEIGSNLNQKLSVVKMTQLVTVTHTDTHLTSTQDIENENMRKLL